VVPLYLVLILGCNCFVNYHLVTAFQQLVLDKEIILNETYKIYSDSVAARTVVRYKIDDTHPQARPQHGETYYYVPARLNPKNPIPEVDLNEGFLGGPSWST